MMLPNNLPSPVGMSRQEIVDLLLREEYGYLPPAPISVQIEELSYNRRFCAGNAPLKTMRLTAQCDFGEFSFPFHYFCPALETPVPCVVLVNFRPDVPDMYLPAEEVADRGYAVLSFCYQDISADNGDFTDGLAGLVYPGGNRSPEQCGKIGLWAWAAIRLLEYALTLPELDHSRISVAGHSRLGKTALLAGALEPRFGCVWSNNSGCSGASLARNNTGETVSKICRRFPFWFCENYLKYAENEDSLPFDQHYLLAANIGHKVYVSSAEGDPWACPENEYLSCVAANEYFTHAGLPGFIHPQRMPEPGEYFQDGQIGYHLRSGCHYMSRKDWDLFLRFANR